MYKVTESLVTHSLSRASMSDDLFSFFLSLSLSLSLSTTTRKCYMMMQLAHSTTAN